MNAFLFLEGDRLCLLKTIHWFGHLKTRLCGANLETEATGSPFQDISGRTATMVYTPGLDFDIPVSYHS